MSGHHTPTPSWTHLLCLLIPDSLVIFSCATLCLSTSLVIVFFVGRWRIDTNEKKIDVPTKKCEDTTSGRYAIEKMWKFLWIVGNWKFTKDCDISQSLWFSKSQRLWVFKITDSWTFNFVKFHKKNRENPRPRPVYWNRFFASRSWACSNKPGFCVAFYSKIKSKS